MAAYKFRSGSWESLAHFLIEFNELANSSEYPINRLAATFEPGATGEVLVEIETDASPLRIRKMFEILSDDLAGESLKSSEFFDGMRNDVFGNQIQANARYKAENL